MHGYAVMRTEAGSQVTWINKFSVGFFFASVFFGCLLKKNEKIKTTEMYGEFRIFNKIKKKSTWLDKLADWSNFRSK